MERNGRDGEGWGEMGGMGRDGRDRERWEGWGEMGGRGRDDSEELNIENN